jgi:hypothetical protein
MADRRLQVLRAVAKHQSSGRSRERLIAMQAS